MLPVFNPELPLPIAKLSRVILLWEVGKRPVDREDAAPTLVPELTDGPTAIDVEMEGTVPTPTFPNIAFGVPILLRCIF